MKKALGIIACSILLAGCASKADTIQPTYVSPLQYGDYSCKQIRAELGRVSRKVNEISGVQDDTASNDAVAMGVGLVLFWPSLFFIAGSDQKVQLGQLKGEYEALEQVAVQKDCNIANEVAAARKMAEQRKAAAAATTKESGQVNN